MCLSEQAMTDRLHDKRPLVTVATHEFCESLVKQRKKGTKAGKRVYRGGCSVFCSMRANAAANGVAVANVEFAKDEAAALATFGWGT